MRILKVCSWIALMCMSCCLMMAQSGSDGEQQPPRRPSFDQFMRQKVKFIVDEMKFTDQDSAKSREFEQMYTRLQKEKAQLMRKYGASGHKLRELKRARKTGLPDSLYLRAARDEVQMNMESAQLEKLYFERFESILTPRQLYRYLSAERKFKGKFMNQGGKQGRETPSKDGKAENTRQ